MSKLIFTKGNAKLSKEIYIFNLPAGHTCPMAHQCLSKINYNTGKLQDGKHTIFRCFAASNEVFFPNTRNQRKHNFDLLRTKKTVKQMAELILESLPEKAKYVRVHASGDFFNQTYFLAWMQVAQQRPNTLFYAYTKSLNFWIDNKDSIPANFNLTASKGGRLDNLISEHNLKYAQVVFSEEEAELLGLEIDHDDSHALKSNKPFALLLHGTQPAGSEASKALQTMRKKGIKGYNRKTRKENLTLAA